MKESSDQTPTLPKEPVAPQNSAKKTKALFMTTVTCSILAVAGIIFGVYGMFFQKDKCELKCEKDGETSTYPSNDIPSQASSPVSLADATQLLKDKYGFESTEYVIYDGWYKYIEDFNQKSKLLFTAHQIEDTLGEGQYLAEIAQVVKNISFEEFNQKYTYYFGSSDPIEKKDYELDGTIRKIVYKSEDDSFDIYFLDGIGGMTRVERFNKVINVTGIEDGFRATIISVTIDPMAKQDTSLFLGVTSDGVNEFYELPISDEQLGDIENSLSAYEFDFKKEDSDYKLFSIQKY